MHIQHTEEYHVRKQNSPCCTLQLQEGHDNNSPRKSVDNVDRYIADVSFVICIELHVTDNSPKTLLDSGRVE